MSKYRIDKKRRTRRDNPLETRTFFFIIIQAILLLLSWRISFYLLAVGFLAPLFFWIYKAERDRYYTWGKYVVVLVGGTALAVSVYFLGGGK